MNSIVPSLMAIIVEEEKDFELIKNEANINTIGLKYLQHTLNTEIPITFIPKKEYEKLLNDSIFNNKLWIKASSCKYISIHKYNIINIILYYFF